MLPRDSFSVGHEPDAMRFRWIVFGAALLIASGVGTGVGMRLLLGVLTHVPRPVDAPRSVVDHVAPPPRDGPPLQPSIGHDTSPTRDLADMRANEDRLFAKMGWTIDAATGQPIVPHAVVDAVAARTTSRPATQEGPR